MKKLYFFQVNYSYSGTAHLPYTAAELSAYAFADKNINNAFKLEKIFFLRDTVDNIMAQIDAPDVAAFSSYIWNFEFNKVIAAEIKNKYPDCVVIFGGHHVTPGNALLENCKFIDYLIHGEGEEAFRRLLIHVIGKDAPESIPGVSFRTPEGVKTNANVINNDDEYIDYPSPYLNGYFDEILEKNPSLSFMALIETTRGCPNSCSYCDWSNMKSRIRKFPMERIKSEIRWISEHKILGLGSADSNFGIFARDEEITDFIIEVFLENHFPIGYQTSYAKNSNDRIFRIGCKLDKYHMNKGVTLSFQSMSEDVLKNIGRSNIPLSNYKELLSMYNKAGVATYTELILGLPGETYDSFADGINTLLELGQHNAVYIHNCEWLPCSVMGNADYMEKFGIKVSRIPLNQPHIDAMSVDGINEWSSLVTETKSMTRHDWAKMNMFSFVVQCFHHMGVLEFFAVYLYNELGVSYRAFYEGVVDFTEKTSSKRLRGAYEYIKFRLYKIAYGDEDAAFTASDDTFGHVQWPYEEFIYLNTVYILDEFYNEITPFLRGFGIDDEIFNELLDFQKNMIKQPFTDEKSMHYSYDFLTYFKAALKNQRIDLKKEKNTVTVKTRRFDSWEEYARTVVWFGRKDSKNVYINEASIYYDNQTESDARE